MLALVFYLYRQNHLEFNNIKLNFIPITLATIPALVVGALIILFDINFFSLQIIGYTSIIGGILLYLSDLKIFQVIKVSDKKIKFLLAGFFQCLAFLPGFSRSGSCIIAFRLMGENRKNSSVMSLYLGMPIILISFLSNIRDVDVMKFDFNPLPASFKIRFEEADDRFDHIQEFANKLKRQKGIESLEYGEDWIARFEKFMAFSRVFVFALGCLLCLGLTFIISNTIRLSIYSRQDEI